MSKTIPSQDLRNAKLAADPTCRVCGETKTVSDFPKHAVDYACTKCRAQYAIRRYHERRAAMSPAELLEHKRRINERQNERRAAKLALMSKEQESLFRSKINASNASRVMRCGMRFTKPMAGMSARVVARLNAHS